jgi:hypothetical protein
MRVGGSNASQITSEGRREDEGSVCVGPSACRVVLVVAVGPWIRYGDGRKEV